MALRLTFCILVVGLAQSLRNVAEFQGGHLERRASNTDKVVYFKAFLPRDITYGVRSTIVFSDVQHNIGGAYNPSSGVFTAPVSGLYEFKCRVQKLSGANAGITLVRQGTEKASTTVLQNWGNHGVRAIMKAREGDHVHVTIRYTTGNKPIQLRKGQFTQFSGVLIHKL